MPLTPRTWLASWASRNDRDRGGTIKRILAHVAPSGASNFVFPMNATRSKSKNESERVQMLLFFQLLPRQPDRSVAFEAAALMEPEGRKIMRVIIARKNPVQKTQFQTADPLPRPASLTDPPLLTTLIAIDRGAIAGIRPIRFCASLSAEQKLGGRARTNVGGGRVNRDFRLPAALFSVRTTNRPHAIGVYQGNPTCPRTTSGRPTCATGSIRIRHCGISSFFLHLFFFLPPMFLSHAVIVIRRSSRECKVHARRW